MPVFIATPTSAWASAGAVAAHRDELAALLLAADQRELVLRRRLREEIVDARLGRDRGGGERVVAGNHHRADAHAAQFREALAHAGLHHVLERHRAQQPPVAHHRERGLPGAGDLVGGAAQFQRGDGGVEIGMRAQHRIDRTLVDQAAAEAEAGKPRLRGEGDRLRIGGQRLRQAVLLAREGDDRSALRRLVGKAGEQRRLGQRAFLDAGERHEGARLPVADRDRAGLVEQQHVAIARRLHRAARFGEHVEAHQPVHPRDADRGEQGGDRGGDQGDEQRRQDRHRHAAAGIMCEARDRADRDQEDDRQPDEQDGERHLVRRLLPLRALDQRDHAIEEAVPRLGGDAHLDPVRDDARAGGDGGTVAARLADDGRALAGDRRLVDAGDALHHLAVGGDQVAGLDQHQLALFELGGGDHFPCLADAGKQLRAQFRLGGAQRCRLRASAPLRQRLGEGAEQHGQPQPRDELREEAGRHLLAADREEQGEQQRDAGGDEQHRVLHQRARIELAEGVADRGRDERRGEHGGCLVHDSLALQKSWPAAAVR